MGRMKDLGQQLTEKLEAYANAAQGSRNAGMQNMVVQGSMYGGQGLVKQRSTIVSNMRGVDNPNECEDVALVAVLLASDAGAGITGSMISIDGGTSPY